MLLFCLRSLVKGKGLKMCAILALIIYFYYFILFNLFFITVLFTLRYLIYFNCIILFIGLNWIWLKHGLYYCQFECWNKSRYSTVTQYLSSFFTKYFFTFTQVIIWMTTFTSTWVILFWSNSTFTWVQFLATLPTSASL